MFALLDRLESLILRLGIVSGFATLLIMVIVCIDVGGRFLFNAPLHSGVETSELLLVSLVFLGLAAAQQQRQNFAIEVLSRLLPPRGQRGLELFGSLLCLIIVVLLAWPSANQAMSSFRRNEMGFGIVAFPVWPARFLLTTGLWLLAFQFAVDILRLICGRPRIPAETRARESFAE